VFLNPDPKPGEFSEIGGIAKQLRAALPSRVVFVTDCLIHFGHRDSAERETYLADTFADADTQYSILRTQHVLSPRSSVSRWIRRLSWVSPLLSDSLRSSFPTLPEFANCVSDEFTRGDVAERRAMTLLGRNESWRRIAEQFARNSQFTRFLTMLARVSRFFGAGVLLRAALKFGLKFCRAWGQSLCFRSITPQSEEELLSIFHRHNQVHIQVCGYNNGVNHFGWQYPGKTVVPTAQTGRTIDVSDDHVLVDAGVTLKAAVDVLSETGKQFYVVPNYSYIAMGTVFFVPVHGSGSQVSTLGDTIEWVKLFDPSTGSVLEAVRGEPLFDETMYNRSCGLVLLQLILKVHDATDYYVQESVLTRPSAADVWNIFEDPETSNIEVRKNRAASDDVQVTKYYTSDGSGQSRLSVPRDSIGGVWDRLEENRFSAFLFHLLVRKLAYHVELFLRKDEFQIFWEHHRRLPVSKIQLRSVKRDGMPNSPFSDADCVSADLFMSRRRRDEFQAFTKAHLPNVRANPGKQST